MHCVRSFLFSFWNRAEAAFYAPICFDSGFWVCAYRRDRGVLCGSERWRSPCRTADTERARDPAGRGV